MRKLTPYQLGHVHMLEHHDFTIHVLDNNVNVCHLLVIDPNRPELLQRMYINPSGKRVATFKYRLVQDPVAAVA